MNFAFIVNVAINRATEKLQYFFRSLAANPIQLHIQTTCAQPKFARDIPINSGAFSKMSNVTVHTSKPLRIVRVLEAGQGQSCVGRMVISGRMTDVCAELDRLAAREAAMS
jgi:hypothetical protein